ncbi:hypothetical protein ERJ75_001428300 [Trypanosoma vivax]|nr:hypothetical protein ERJ75_001428300 [Trypanosoma vivax]
MPSRPGFLLQDAWDEMAVWARAVAEVGLMEARIGWADVFIIDGVSCMRPAHVQARKWSRRRGAGKARIARRAQRPKTTNACGESNEMLQLRANGALQPCALCEDGSWALLESKNAQQSRKQ